MIILLGIISLSTRGLNESIDFKGGQSWLVTSPTLTVAQAAWAAESAEISQPPWSRLANQLNHTRQIQVTVDLNSKSATERTAVENRVPQHAEQGGEHHAGQRQLQRSRGDLGLAGHDPRPSGR